MHSVYHVLVARLNWGAWLNVPKLSLATILFAHDPLSSLAYLMITYTHPAAGNLSKKTLVAK